MVDLARAQIGHSANGSIIIDDPDCPWLVRAWIDKRGRLRRLHLDMRAGVPGELTASALRDLPRAQIVHKARSEAAAGEWPNEAFYRLLAAPKPTGSRHWPDEHWENVLTVYEWAVDTDRPGGGPVAVADMWGVSVDPTAYRWLAIARNRQ